MRRWLREGGWRRATRPDRQSALADHEEWLAERFRRHGGNADVVREELAAEKGVTVCLRTMERVVAPLRQALRAEARATVRFETAPGEQLQIDFGKRRVEIGDATVAVFLFVATLGWSRRIHVRAFLGERQEDWFDGMESAFAAFGACRRRCCSTARAL